MRKEDTTKRSEDHDPAIVVPIPQRPTLYPSSDTERHLRISAFAGRFSNNTHYEQLAQVKEAAEVAAKRGADLLVLPGYSFGCAPIRVGKVQELVDRTDLAMLAEVGDTEEGVTALFQPCQPPKCLMKQQFVSGAGANADPAAVRQVIEAIQYASGVRRIEMGGVQIGVLLCGESSILRNREHKYTEARFPGLEWPLTYDVLVNPAHSTMRRWGELHKNFAYFSQDGRTLIHVTNRGHPKDKTPRRAWGATLCVYRDGQHLATGDSMFDDGNGMWKDLSPADEWRMITLDIT